METQLLQVVAEDLLEQHDALLHVRLVEAVKRKQVRLRHDVVEQHERRVVRVRQQTHDAADVAHALHVADVGPVHRERFEDFLESLEVGFGLEDVFFAERARDVGCNNFYGFFPWNLWISN